MEHFFGLKCDMKTVCCEEGSCSNVQGQLKEANTKAGKSTEKLFLFNAECDNEESYQWVHGNEDEKN